MVAHQRLGARSSALLQRLDDMQVVADRTIGAILLADRLHPDHAHMGEQVLGEPDQHAIAAHADDGLVKLDVDLGIFVEPGMQLAVLEGGEHFAQRGDVLVAGILGDEARRHAFERRPGGDHFDHLALGLAHYVDAAARHRPHEAFALKLRHRLAHRCAADAEVLRQPALVEPHFGALAIDVERDDHVLERRIGPILEACRAHDRFDRDRRATQLVGGLGAMRTVARTHGREYSDTLGRYGSGIQYSSSGTAATFLPVASWNSETAPLPRATKNHAPEEDAIMFELQEIFAAHLTTMVFVYGSAVMLTANLIGALVLGHSFEKGRTRGVLRHAA